MTADRCPSWCAPHLCTARALSGRHMSSAVQIVDESRRVASVYITQGADGRAGVAVEFLPGVVFPSDVSDRVAAAMYLKARELRAALRKDGVR